MAGDILSQTFHHLDRLGQERWWGWPASGITASWIGGLLAQVDYTHVINLIALGIVAVGSSLLGLWRLWEVQQIKVWEERRKAQIRVDEEQRASAARVPIVAIVSPAVNLAHDTAPGSGPGLPPIPQEPA